MTGTHFMKETTGFPPEQRIPVAYILGLAAAGGPRSDYLGSQSLSKKAVFDQSIPTAASILKSAYLIRIHLFPGPWERR